MNNGWTLERKAKQSALIRRWRPWERSTGPRTQLGKGRASRNAGKGGIRSSMRAVALALKTCQTWRNELET